MKTKGNDISSEINHLSNTEERWFAVYTKYKCEKFVANLLAKKNISAEDVEAGNISLKEGDQVEVMSGQLTGLEGMLLESEGNKRFVVALKVR